MSAFSNYPSTRGQHISVSGAKLNCLSYVGFLELSIGLRLPGPGTTKGLQAIILKSTNRKIIWRTSKTGRDAEEKVRDWTRALVQKALLVNSRPWHRRQDCNLFLLKYLLMIWHLLIYGSMEYPLCLVCSGFFLFVSVLSLIHVNLCRRSFTSCSWK